MAQYNYEATNERGDVVSGEIDLADQGEVAHYLEKHRLTPLRISSAGKLAHKFEFAFFERLSVLDQVFLVRSLGITITSGLNLLEALDILLADATKPLLRKILLQARVNLSNGQPLSYTFQTYNRYFSSAFIGLIRAGEASGQLDKTLQQLTDYLTREHELRRKVRGALAYPALLLSASFLVILLLLFFVLPRLAATFTQAHLALPVVTRVLLSISEFATAHPVFLLLVSAGIIVGLSLLGRIEKGRHLLSSFLFHIPVVKELIKKIALVRFTKTLGTLLASGVSITEALDLAEKTVGNEVYKQAIHKSAEQILSGAPLSRSLEQYPELFPRFLTGLMLIGEKTGTTEHVLQTFANFYEDEIDQALKTLTSFLEPMLLLFMGLLVGLIALSILLPIYQLVGSVT
jgi:type II secretory pathway component PulF